MVKHFSPVVRTCSSWAQNRISLRYPLRGGLVISIFVFSLYFQVLLQNIIWNSTYLLQCYFTLYSFRLNHFLNSLLQYDNFSKIRQKKDINPPVAFFVLYIWRILKKLAYCIRELRKWFCRKLHEVKETCSKYVEFNTMFCDNLRKYKGKNKNWYYKVLLSSKTYFTKISFKGVKGYLCEIRFWAQENMS